MIFLLYWQLQSACAIQNKFFKSLVHVAPMELKNAFVL